MDYMEAAPSAAAIASRPGWTLLDFGTDWCGWCQQARPLVDAAVGANAAITHLRVEDGKGRPLGRAYGVRLWPTLILLQDGVEQSRLVRPQSDAEVMALLDAAR